MSVRRQLSRSTRALAATATGLVGFGIPVPVAADSYAAGPPDSGYRPDNSEHTWCYGNTFTWQDARDAASYAAVNLDNQTTMYDTYMGNCSQNTDAIWVRETNPAYYGSYTCEDFNQNGTCEKGIVRLNFDTLSRDDGGSIDLWKSVACQELGHSVGLTHASNDCMGNLSLLEYSPHHVNHVNNDRWP